MKKLFIAVLLLFSSLSSLNAQDTLHIYYSGLYSKILDSNDVKIAKWAKSLNGKKVNVQVLAYYNASEFKKYSQERADELFLVLNRKARDLINITSIGPVRGQKSQRSRADIVFTPQVQDAPIPEKKEVAKTEKPKEEKSEEKAKEEKKEKPKKEKEEIAKKESSKKEKSETQEKKPVVTEETPKTASKSSDNAAGADEFSSAPTTTVSESEPLKVLVNGEWVEYQNGKKVKKKK